MSCTKTYPDYLSYFFGLPTFKGYIRSVVAINQGFIAMLPFEKVSNLFFLYWCEAHQDEIVNYANGSTFLEISKGNFRKISILTPSMHVMEAFDSFVRPLFNGIVSNLKASRILNTLRDALLPKLISGKIRVSDAE